jgi:hypothetical protein
MKQEFSLDLEKNNLGITNMPTQFNVVKKNKEILEKNKRTTKPKVGVKDIQWALCNLNSSSKKNIALDKEYESRLGLKRKSFIEEFKVPTRTYKQIMEDKENLRLYESLVENNTEQNKVDRLKKIDNFIQSSSPLIEENLDNSDTQDSKIPLSIEEIRSIEATSDIISKYLNSELNNYGPDYFKKKIRSDKQKYFDPN